jgi:hypothetical protein
MPDSSTSLTPHRCRGGQLGNQNALKHGFYTIQPEVLSRLTTDMKGDISDEMDALRSLVDTTLAVFTETEHPTLDQCLSTLRGVSQAFDTMRGLYLTQKLLYRSQTSIDQALDELAQIPVEDD